MKAISSFTFFLMAFLTVNAQNYRPLLEESKKWHCYYTNGKYEMNFNYYLNGDTIIDGDRYSCLYGTVVNQWTGETSQGYVGALLEKDRRVYYTNNVHNKLILYDFDLKKGDVVPGNGQWRVDDVDSIYVMGGKRKRMTLKHISNDQNEGRTDILQYWVEGIGSSRGLEWLSLLPLVSCYENDHCVFTSMNFEGMPTTPVNDETKRPLLSEGKEWWYKDGSSFMYNRREDFRMFVQGDTIIGGKTWKKLYRDNTDNSMPIYDKAIREEDGRVYELRQGKAESLLFDFTLDIGDRYVPTDKEDSYMEVIAIDTVISAGLAHRRLVLQQHVNGVETDLTCWVEGVGGDCGIDLTAFWSDMDSKVLNHQGKLTYYWNLFMGCSYQNGKCIYGVVPDITTSVSRIKVEKRNNVGFHFDLQGRHIQGEPAKKGVYVKNGKKYVKK